MTLPDAIARVPELDRWLAFNPDGTVMVNTGKVEIGQGIRTAIAMIAAEELDVAVNRIVVQTADTEVTPNEFITAGSMSIEGSGSAVRVASATARTVLLEMAAADLDVPLHTLIVEDGVITSADSNEQTDYWSLQGGHHFGVTIVDVPELKDPDTYTTVGHKGHRVDLPDKVRGNAAFVHDMTLPGMRYGRVVKPPNPNASLVSAPDELAIAGVEIVQDGSFLGVIADREETAVRAAEALSAEARWEVEPLATTPEAIPEYLRQNVAASYAVEDGTPREGSVTNPDTPKDATITHNATYYRPYQMHGSLGPSAALAQYMNGKLTVYSHSQGVEILKLALADVLGLPEDEVHIVHAEGSGCYGHNGADDVALDAALLAIASEPDPIKVQWSRADEHGFEPYGPATLIDMQASLDGSGRIVDWHHESIGFSHAGRPRPTPGYSNLQPSWSRERAMAPAPRRPALMAEVGIHRNLEPIYAFPRKHLVKHFVAESPLRTSSLRSLGAFANVFAIESFMDELAHAAERDPFEFRIAHLEDRRAVDVLDVLRERAPEVSTDANAGRGLAIARYKNRQAWCAILVDLHVDDDASISLDNATIVADAGLVIDSDGLTNQLEGGFIQAASWTLKEAVDWDENGVTTLDWSSYPILGFSEVPSIETFLVDRRGEPALGVGEASTGPAPAAIANAVFAATGLRLREIPFTPERIRAAAGQT
jgi:CO/xanthine dehydrogenase Mo-binding subunit